VTPAPAIAAESRALDAGATDLKAIADAGRFCGEKDLPDCPLQLWMKRNATPPIRAGDAIALGEAFEQMASFAPRAREAYPNWGSIARDGAQASRVGDVTAAKAACRGCHTQYRARYHAELRGLALPNPPARQ
jgi:hypothetical protein